MDTSRKTDGWFGSHSVRSPWPGRNKRVRSDRGLQGALGRKGCAEQSVVQGTLDACTEENVRQMQEALDIIYRRHSQGYQHNYKKCWQLLDVDMTGRPCGKKALLASKGYFAKQRNRRGRQEGYLIATYYDEIVSKQLFDGKTQLTRALRPLVEAAEKTLDLDEAKRQRTILRVDSGGGGALLTSTGLWLAAINSRAKTIQAHGLETWPKR